MLALAAVLQEVPASPHASSSGGGGQQIAGIPVEFFLFAATLLGVALFHHKTLQVALTGLAVILAYKLTMVTGFDLLEHLEHESKLLLNLLGLLVGFGLLSAYFSESRVPELLPRFLPNDWKGPFLLLVLVFVLSSFLDNIAAAMIGGTVASTVFRKRVHVGYIAGIVAASNAGGSGSVVGDTTTTMMWIDGKPPSAVFHAYVAAVVALIVCGLIAARQQDRHERIVADPPQHVKIDWTRLGIVVLILALAIVANFQYDFPAGGVWIAILLGAILRRPAWHEVPSALKGAIFLLSLVLCASMMPVDALPLASWQTALGLGFVSAVFDNIPLTKLALDQGGYDWGMLAYTVGFGGSMIWFGSSAGVAISNQFPEARSVGSWLKHGWHVALAYVIGFFALYFMLGWHPTDHG